MPLILVDAGMWLATKFGFFDIVQTVPADDGDAAVYQVRSHVRGDLEVLLQATGFQREVMSCSNCDYHYCVWATQQEVFEIMNALAESIDYGSFEAAIAEIPGQQRRLAGYRESWRALAKACTESTSYGQ